MATTLNLVQFPTILVWCCRTGFLLALASRVTGKLVRAYAYREMSRCSQVLTSFGCMEMTSKLSRSVQHKLGRRKWHHSTSSKAMARKKSAICSDKLRTEWVWLTPLSASSSFLGGPWISTSHGTLNGTPTCQIWAQLLSTWSRLRRVGARTSPWMSQRSTFWTRFDRHMLESACLGIPAPSQNFGASLRLFTCYSMWHHLVQSSSQSFGQKLTQTSRGLVSTSKGKRFAFRT
mmetsp:Transcript_133259/g.259440  ORF Transcript_133259/g.259440 Transcript_133259/m.259440 type:complete len:233 (+) Transcript_133259:579-1277(+)